MSGKNPLGNGKEPQSYEGLNVLVPLGGWQVVKARRDPTSNDKKYPVTTLWVNTVSQNIWFQTQAGGTWQQVSSSSSSAVAAVANGGTGQSSLTDHGVLVGSGTSPVDALAVGTNGQVLLGSTGADPVFGTLTTPNSTLTYTTGAGSLGVDVASSFLAQTTVTLTSAQIKALRATPITLVAAPGAGKSVFFLGAQLKSIYGGTNAFTGPQNLAIRYQNTTGTVVSTAITGTGFLDQTANEYQTVGISTSSTIAAATVVENQPLVIHNTGAAEITGNAANDNTIKVTIQYAILTQ